MGLIMTFLRMLFVMAVASLFATQLQARSSVRVCNSGQLAVYVATAVPDTGPWKVKGWWKVAPGDCEVIHDEWNACEYTYSFSSCDTVYFGFSFTDSTGAWGATTKVEDGSSFNPEDFHDPGRTKICVKRENFDYAPRDSESGCTGQPGAFLIPAAVLFKTYSGDLGADVCCGFRGHTIKVALSSSDRAIPVGPQGSSRPAPPAPSSARSPDAPTWGGILGQLAQLGAAVQASRQRQQRDLVAASIEAAATGFENCRQGPGQVTDRERVWDLSPNPGQTEGCHVNEGATTGVLFECDLFSSASWTAIEATYAEWVKSAMAVFPPDWRRTDVSQSNPGGFPGQEFVSSSGVRGLIWIEQHPEIGKYVLFFRVSTRAAR